MNLVSVTGSDGGSAARMAHVATTVPTAPRPGGRSGGSGEAVPVAPATVGGPQDALSRADAGLLVENMNADLGVLHEKLGFRVDDGTGQIVVQIVDRASGEVVRESPPREFLDLAARMKEMVGLFLDEQG